MSERARELKGTKAKGLRAIRRSGIDRKRRSLATGEGRASRTAECHGTTALCQLHRDHFDQMVRLSRIRIRNAIDAEDLVQEAFLAVRRAYPDKMLEDLRPLLFRTLRNLTLNYLKSGNTKRRQSSVDVSEVYVGLACPRTATPETQLIDTQLLGIAERAIEAMSPRRREVLMLHRFEQLTFDEIAKRLSISSTTAKSDLAIAIAEVAEALAKAETQSGSRRVARK